MIKNYFGAKLRKTKPSERAEAVPAAIITAIVSSLLLLGIASTISLVVQSKVEAESSVQLTTIASNIDVSMRSDVANASYITASAHLKQPEGRLLDPSDISLGGVNMHIPVGETNECKLVRWSATGDTVTRELKIYEASKIDDKTKEVKCDESSAVSAERKKVFAENITVTENRFLFYNQVGRELTFHHTNDSLATINTALDSKLKAQNVEKLNNTDFNALNSMLKPDSFKPAFADTGACAMNAERVAEVCPPIETPAITAAWNSIKIGKVGINLEIAGGAGDSAKRDIEQNSSIPLYRDVEEAAAAVAGSTTENRPKAPRLTISDNPVRLGDNYTLAWEAAGSCPTGMTQTFNVYENGSLIYSGAGLQAIRSQINASVQYIEASAETQCERGALQVVSIPALLKTPLVPPAPVLALTKQPTVTDAAVNSIIESTATCLYGTTPHYDVIQAIATYGVAGTTKRFSTTKVNIAINSNGFTVGEGAKYEYKVSAWCASPFADSSATEKSTGTFTTAINIPSTPKFIAPLHNQTRIDPNSTMTWTAVTCGVGAKPHYYVVNDFDSVVAPERISVNWVENITSHAMNQKQGRKLGYYVRARCQGASVNSPQSGYDGIRFGTLVNAPGPITSVWNNGWSWVDWMAPSVGCAPEAPIKYRVVQTKADNSAGYVAAAWQTGGGNNLPNYNTGGYPQWATVEAFCDGLDVDSDINTSGATTKWVKNFDVGFSVGMQWRRMNVWANCPFATDVRDLQVYVAADGWNGPRYDQGIQTDQGHVIAAAGAGPGGNSGWVALNSNQNTQWIQTTASWGYYGNSGWGARYTVNNRSPSMEGTYWNASAWGNFAYWWYGKCTTPFMEVSVKGSYWEGGGIRNVGNPNARWDSQANGRSLTAEGQTAVR